MEITHLIYSQVQLSDPYQKKKFKGQLRSELAAARGDRIKRAYRCSGGSVLVLVLKALQCAYCLAVTAVENFARKYFRFHSSTLSTNTPPSPPHTLFFCSTDSLQPSHPTPHQKKKKHLQAPPYIQLLPQNYHKTTNLLQNHTEPSPTSSPYPKSSQWVRVNPHSFT